MARSVTIPAAMRRALAELKTGPRHREASLGAILCPKPISLDAWEAIAAPMQATLMQVSAEDHERAEAAPVQAMPSGSRLSTTTHAKTPWTRS